MLSADFAKRAMSRHSHADPLLVQLVRRLPARTSQRSTAQAAEGREAEEQGGGRRRRVRVSSVAAHCSDMARMDEVGTAAAQAGGSAGWVLVCAAVVVRGILPGRSRHYGRAVVRHAGHSAAVGSERIGRALHAVHGQDNQRLITAGKRQRDGAAGGRQRGRAVGAGRSRVVLQILRGV